MGEPCRVVEGALPVVSFVLLGYVRCAEGQREPCIDGRRAFFTPYCGHYPRPASPPCEAGVRWMPWSFRLRSKLRGAGRVCKRARRR